VVEMIKRKEKVKMMPLLILYFSSTTTTATTTTITHTISSPYILPNLVKMSPLLPEQTSFSGCSEPFILFPSFGK
jgi:hypothetical protein